MIIQSNNGVTAYSGIASSSMQRQGSKTVPATMDDTANTAGRVTLSSSGKTLAASESDAEQTRTPAQIRLLQSAASDSQSAEKIASDMAHARSTIFYDISSVDGGGEVNKLSSSGRIINDAFKNKFDSEASVIDAQRLAIYDSEKAKGTDPLLILSKMIDFTNAQSKDYLEASGWGYRGTSQP